MKLITQGVVYCTLVLAGMAGLYYHVEYSGWVLFVGLVGAVVL